MPFLAYILAFLLRHLAFHAQSVLIPGFVCRRFDCVLYPGPRLLVALALISLSLPLSYWIYM
jgi:hypothetical protein